MTDRPMLFSAPMIRALLAGRKTQTRRIVRFPVWAAGCFTDPLKIEVETADDAGHGPEVICESTGCLASLPVRNKVGDRLWVKEAHAVVGSGDPGLIVTRADYPECVLAGYDNVPPASEIRWRPSIHMWRHASRLTLTVTDVRVQRLQEISETDAIAEGLRGTTKDGKLVKYGIPDKDELPGSDDHGWPWAEWEADPRAAYATLWGKIHGPESWAANPWVSALTFSVDKRNIDQ